MKLGLRPTLSLISALLATLLLAACGAPPRHFAPAAESGRGYYKVGAPYQIDGVWYYPKEDLSYDETGIASWYGEQFHGRYTANGEIFDLNALTAAHRTLPMPSVVRVTNLENGRAIKLRVNDRGPYARGRILDVSRRGAQLLGFEGNGTAKVRVQIMVEDSIQVAAIAKRGGAPEAPSAIAEAADTRRGVPTERGTRPCRGAARDRVGAAAAAAAGHEDGREQADPAAAGPGEFAGRIGGPDRGTAAPRNGDDGAGEADADLCPGGGLHAAR